MPRKKKETKKDTIAVCVKLDRQIAKSLQDYCDEHMSIKSRVVEAAIMEFIASKKVQATPEKPTPVTRPSYAAPLQKVEGANRPPAQAPVFTPKKEPVPIRDIMGTIIAYEDDEDEE